jgi:outer membrane protein assembly factor BamE (lipoprotein component of BamABCDE complex)
MCTLPLRLAAITGSLAVSLATSACKTGAEHRESLGKLEGEELTVGNVQRKIAIGMSGAEVAEALGSPNLVSTDEQHREVWIYDRVATENVVSSGGGGAWLLLGAVNASAGASRSSQRTITVIVKFDEQRKVRDFAYHASRF